MVVYDPSGQISIDARIAVRGLAWKFPCCAATTANITIATALNAGDVIDGVTLAAGDHVLVKDQSTASQNGIYIVGATPIRAWDMDQDLSSNVPIDEVRGAVVLVFAGTVNGGKLFRTTNTATPTLGSTSIVWTEVITGGSSDAILRYGGGAEWLKAHGSMGSTETIDLADGNVHTGTLNANCTLTFTGAVATIGGQAVSCMFRLELTQDGTGGRTVTFPGSVSWDGGSAPTLDTTPGALEVLEFTTDDGGTTWLGFHGGASSITVKDEGSPLTTVATSLDFVGAGVTASGSGGGKTITIPGGATASDAGIWRPVLDGATGAVLQDGTGQAIMGFGPA